MHVDAQAKICTGKQAQKISTCRDAAQRGLSCLGYLEPEPARSANDHDHDQRIAGLPWIEIHGDRLIQGELAGLVAAESQVRRYSILQKTHDRDLDGSSIRDDRV